MISTIYDQSFFEQNKKKRLIVIRIAIRWFVALDSVLGLILSQLLVKTLLDYDYYF